MSQEFHTLTIDKIVQETSDTVSIFFQIPDSIQQVFHYKAGQYVTVRFHIDEKEERRSYSLSTSPLEPGFAVTVKKVDDGLVSKHINESLKAGDQIEVMPPEGRFHLAFSHEEKRDLYLIGAGSGITPIMSIIKTALEEEPLTSIHLLYGSRNENEIIFKKMFDDLEEKYSGQLTVDHMISGRGKGKKGFLGGLFKKGNLKWETKSGRITTDVIKSFLAEHPAKGTSSVYLLCGPGDLIKQTENYLSDIGVDKKAILKEHFVSAADLPAESSVDSVHGGLTVHLNGNKIQLPIKDKSILDTLLDADYDAPYSCHSGACATCMAKVINGTVEMDVCFALDDDEIEEGFILTCQAHPTSENVEVSFDE